MFWIINEFDFLDGINELPTVGCLRYPQRRIPVNLPTYLNFAIFTLTNYHFMKNQFFKLLAAVLLTATLTTNAFAQKATVGKIWSPAKANSWYAQHKWMSGADFIPSTAINQLEMWQADTFDPATIDKELGYAEGIRFNTMRVFLYSLAWQQDKAGFKKRVDQYLTIANKHIYKPCLCFLMIAGTPMPKLVYNLRQKQVSIIRVGCRTPVTGKQNPVKPLCLKRMLKML
jgi:hypothetical protein